MIFGTWNIRGSRNKMTEILGEIDEHKLDVAVCTNSHVCKGKNLNAKCVFANFREIQKNLTSDSYNTYSKYSKPFPGPIIKISA